jgi:putative RecB family exonuclease
VSDIATQPRSVSQAEQYEACGWRFYLRRVERVIPLPAAWSHHGTAFHSAAEAAERSGRAMGAEEAVQLFSDHYSALVNKALDQEPNLDRWLSASGSGAEDIERRYALGQDQTRQYVEWAREHGPKIWATPSGEDALELYFEVEIGSVSVRGYIDQLIADSDGSIRVRDLKTGSTKSRLQLETYALAIRQLYGVPVNRGDWYLAKRGRLSRPVRLADTDDQQVGARYTAMDAGVKRGDFPPAPGFGCRFCDVQHKCSYSSQA